MVRTLIFFLLSTSLGFGQIKQHQVGDLTVDVYLPPKYDADAEYSVVYSNDGEWLFGELSWNLDTRLNEWIRSKKIEPVIFVAIYNSGARESKYIPFQDYSIGSYQLNAESYTNNIIEEVIPFIEKEYSASDQRAIMGASFGGLHSTWAGLNNPAIFDFIIAQSPSYWVADFKIHEQDVSNTDQTIWIDIGTRDWDDVLSMYYHLSQKGFKPGENLFYYEDHGGMHVGASWRERLLYPLILFTKGSAEIVSLQMTTEYIPSVQRRGYYFSRINPVATLKNGIKHTPFPFNFDSKNGNIQVSPYGSFKIEAKTNDNVFGEYLGKTDEVKVRWADNPMYN